jgi:hypothetical protein
VTFFLQVPSRLTRVSVDAKVTVIDKNIYFRKNNVKYNAMDILV